MIAELGHFALVLALVLAAVQGIAPMAVMRRASGDALILAQRAAYAQLALIFVSFLALTYSFVVSDFSLAVVTANSHVAKPLVYKIAGCLLYTSPSPRDISGSRMPSSA